LPLFNRCRQCNNKVVSIQLLCVITICDRNHKLIWRSQNKSIKRPLGNILIGSALTLSRILHTHKMVAFCDSLITEVGLWKLLFYIIPTNYNL